MALLFLMAGVSAIFYTGTDGASGLQSRSFLGISGSPMARLVSRMVTDRGDDALHGGATHDVRFSPQTAPGRIVAKVAGGRGELGAKNRRRGKGGVKEAYSKDVGRWVTVARDLDPGNFDALLAYCHYLHEGGFPVEVEGDFGGERAAGFPKNGDDPVSLEDRRKNVALAVREFFKNSPLSDKSAWYSAAAAAQMLHEVDPAHFGLRRGSQMRRLRALMKMLVQGGDACGVTWGSEADAAAARQFAVALIHSLDEAEETRQEDGKNTLFKRTEIP